MNFQTIWIPKGILAKILSENSWSWETFLSKVCSSKLTNWGFPFLKDLPKTKIFNVQNPSILSPKINCSHSFSFSGKNIQYFLHNRIWYLSSRGQKN